MWRVAVVLCALSALLGLVAGRIVQAESMQTSPGINLSGDCTNVGNVITCTKTNGVALASGATTAVGTAAGMNTGTSGGTVPLLNANNTWSGTNAFPKSAVSGLPTCNAGSEGLIYGVTDALLPVALAAVAGLGAVHVLAYCTGAAWIVL